jgi:hypothetical protein
MTTVSASLQLLSQRSPNVEVRRFLQQYHPVFASEAPTAQVPAPALKMLAEAYEDRGRTLARHQLIILVSVAVFAVVLLLLLRLFSDLSPPGMRTLGAPAPDGTMD